jgi:hypothetical protein
MACRQRDRLNAVGGLGNDLEGPLIEQYRQEFPHPGVVGGYQDGLVHVTPVERKR